MYTVIDLENNEIEINNEIFKSQFLEDANQEEKIPITLEIKKYYFEQDLSQLTDSKLVKYIIFWDYLLSDECMVNGVIEYISRNREFFFRVSISSEIDKFMRECLHLTGKTNKHGLYYLKTKKGINSFFRNGNLEMVKYLHLQGGCQWSFPAVGYAASGHLECLKYLYSQGCKWDFYTCIEAANGHLECLKYLHENGCPWNLLACQKAASGHLDCLKYLHSQGCPWNSEACSYAARGHLECLKYLHENGCPWDSSACAFAARGGHLECLKYLYENGCLCDSSACENAARGGHLDCLIYLHGAGCEWDIESCIDVARYHPDIMDYLEENK